MNLGLIGGLAAAEGFTQGQRDAEDRRYLQQQRANQQQQVDYQRSQQQRTLEQQRREDTRRAADAAIQSSRTETVDYGAGMPGVDDEGNQMPSAAVTRTTQVPREEQIRAMAENARKAGAQDDWVKLTAEAERLEAARMSAQFQDILANAGGKSVADLANDVKRVWGSGSSLPLQVGNVTTNADGSVTMMVTNRATGISDPRTYKNADDMLKGVRAMADPAGYAALQKSLQEAKIKADEKLAENPYLTVPGGYVDRKTGTFHPTMVGSDTGMTDSQGNPIYSNRAPGSGAGSATGAGKPPKGSTGDVAADALALLASAAEKSEDKLTIEQRSRAQENVGRIVSNNANMPAAMVARVAAEIARDPSKMTPAFNPKTGMVDLVFDDGVNGPVKLNVGIGDAINQGGLRTIMAQRLAAANGGKQPSENEVRAAVGDAMRAAVPKLLAQFPSDEAQLYQRAAFDPVARNDLQTDVKKRAQQAVEEVSQGKTPQQRAAAEQAAQQALRQRLQVIGRVLDAVHAYGPQPQAANPAASNAGPIQRTGAQTEAARRFGRDLDAPSVTERLAGAASRGLKGAIEAASTPSDALIEGTRQKIAATGRMEDGDAIVLATALQKKPHLKTKFTQEELDAISAISGRKF